MPKLDARYLESRRIGRENGLEVEDELKAWAGGLEAAHRALLERSRDPGAMLGWIHLPEATEEARAILRYRQGTAWAREVVVLGIGGSALGARALYQALAPADPPARLHFVDHTDPGPIARLMAGLDPERTLVLAVSKSGGTAETLAALLVFHRWLEDALGEGWREHLAAVTDPERGPLRAYARAQGLAAFSVPPDVGGRFSVFSPVGLVPLAFAGVAIEDLLMGARRANARAREEAAQSALFLYLLERHRGKRVHVLMPYGKRLEGVADWFVQLHAESLGKARDRRGSRVHLGPTPLAALGPTDQHSLLQLLREGPNDKLVAMVRAEDPGEDLRLPELPGLPAAGYLFGKTLAQLQDAEARGTALALAEAGRPVLTLTIPAVDAPSLGDLLQFLMWQTAFLGELYGINAFDQPGVELAKTYTYALMGREGYEEVRRRLEGEA